jgi:hypothetical protein
MKKPGGAGLFLLLPRGRRGRTVEPRLPAQPVS